MRKDALKITRHMLDEINCYLLEKDNPVVDRLLGIIEKHGGAEKVNRKAAENGAYDQLIKRVNGKNRAYVQDLEWLREQKQAGRFISIEEYKNCIGAVKNMLDPSYQVTLEISSLYYFPWLIVEAKRAIQKGELMPARYIRVRCMKEQEADGDLPATAAAMKLLGASWVESLDTRGTDGSNVHLGGPDTITGYFGGIGQPNDHVYGWVDEYLYYYTHYGVKQVLNINAGTILAGYLLYRLGVNIEFKISVFMGNDNPMSVLWTLLMAKLFAREDGSTPLTGFNLSNSANNDTIERTSEVRKAFGFEKAVRIEHHIVETYRHIVIQPYDRLAELFEVAAKVKNISAKHEGGIPGVEEKRKHPSDILEYFLSKEEIAKKNLMPALEQNYMDKHAAVQRTAEGLLKRGIPVAGAPALHHR